MSEQEDQTNRPPELKEEDIRYYESQMLYDVEHKTNIILCYVSGNDLGDRVYGVYIEDKEGLKKPIGFEMRVNADGTVKFRKARNALEILVFLKPELEEQLEREEEEELQRER